MLQNNDVANRYFSPKSLFDNGSLNQTMSFKLIILNLDPCSDNVEVLKALLRHGANANGFGEGSRGALHLAAQSNNLAMAKILLLYGANVNLATKYDLQSPLHLAVKQGNGDMVELLLRHEANVEQRDLYGGQVCSQMLEWNIYYELFIENKKVMYKQYHLISSLLN